IHPILSIPQTHYHLQTIQFPYFHSTPHPIFHTPIPTTTIQLPNRQKVRIATLYDLITSQYRVQRFQHQLQPTSYHHPSSKYTPPSQQQITPIKK
ncbi:hypothetical protein, partial [Staphylococcus epidermidis]|uniref:hypothetical protein n=1 Tax=Staphylococcus epidermidis TaxID=1282 RepID=UPI0021B32B06